MKRWAASFRDFAKPKTSLMSQTERGLTSEFGMGSGGSHALWPVTQLPSTAILFKRIGELEIYELHTPELIMGRDGPVYPNNGSDDPRRYKATVGAVAGLKRRARYVSHKIVRRMSKGTLLSDSLLVSHRVVKTTIKITVSEEWTHTKETG